MPVVSVRSLAESWISGGGCSGFWAFRDASWHAILKMTTVGRWDAAETTAIHALLTRMTTDRLMLVWIVAALVGCSAPPSAQQAVASWDSGGVRVVLNRHPKWAEGQGWVFSSASPVLFQGPMDLHDGVILSDGTVVGLDRDAKMLHVFAPTGELIRSVGGEGSGPGEYREPTEMAPYRGDSVVVYDRRLGRTTVLSSRGETGRLIPVRIPTPRVQLLGSLDDGSIVVLAATFTPQSGIWRDTAALVRIPAGGGSLDTVATVPGAEFYDAIFRGSRQFGVRPYGRSTIGSARGRRITINRGEGCDVETLLPSGELVTRARHPCARSPITDEVVTAAEADELAGFRSDEARQFATAFYEAELRPYPDFAPPYDALLTDASGRIWARRYSLAGDSPARPWAIFDEEGRWLGEVMVTGNFRLIHVADTTALGQVVDTLGHSYLALRRIAKGGRR